eukprot:6092418-Amphidinium_carterae.1
MVIHKHNAIRDHLKDYAEMCHIPAHIEQNLAHLRADDSDDDAAAPACSRSLGQRRTETADLHLITARAPEVWIDVGVLSAASSMRLDSQLKAAEVTKRRAYGHHGQMSADRHDG